MSRGRKPTPNQANKALATLTNMLFQMFGCKAPILVDTTYVMETLAGTLRMHIYPPQRQSPRIASGAWIACSFDDPGLAVVVLRMMGNSVPTCNKHNGKWNFMSIDDAEEVAYFTSNLKRLQPSDLRKRVIETQLNPGINHEHT